ncbi:MAG: hypothetical protein GY754_10760 [bacterium]|nr:hypothetical protein [bacterium]
MTDEQNFPPIEEEKLNNNDTNNGDLNDLNDPNDKIESLENETPVVESVKASAPKVFGVLLIVFGIIYALYGIISGSYSLISSPDMDSFNSFALFPGVSKDSVSTMIANLKLITTIQGVLTLVAGLLSIVAVTAGIGLAQYKEKLGRKLSLTWGYIALAYLVVDAIIFAALIMPLQSGMMSAFPAFAGGFAGMATGSSVFMYVLVTGFFAVMPILTVAMMTQSSAKESCEG